MQAIQTRYHGPTNHRGSTVIARCDAGRVFMPWRHDLSIDENHKAAARTLMTKLGWSGRAFVSGTLPDGSCAHVFVEVSS